MSDKITSPVMCVHCNVPMEYRGIKTFHQGTRFWDTMEGFLEPVLEHFDVHVCQRCGRIELEPTAQADSTFEDDEGLELLKEGGQLFGIGEWDQALAVYQRILQNPKFHTYHDTARHCLKLIQERKAESAVQAPLGGRSGSGLLYC